MKNYINETEEAHSTPLNEIQSTKIKMRFLPTHLEPPLIRKQVRERKTTEKKSSKTYTSETAKVRPVSGWGALGGAGWGGGSNCNFSINAPKSSLIAFLSFFVMKRIPANPNPNRTHRLAELEAMIARKERVSETLEDYSGIQAKGFRQRKIWKISR